MPVSTRSPRRSRVASRRWSLPGPPPPARRGRHVAVQVPRGRPRPAAPFRRSLVARAQRRGPTGQRLLHQEPRLPGWALAKATIAPTATTRLLGCASTTLHAPRQAAARARRRSSRRSNRLGPRSSRRRSGARRRPRRSPPNTRARVPAHLFAAATMPARNARAEWPCGLSAMACFIGRLVPARRGIEASTLS